MSKYTTCYTDSEIRRAAEMIEMHVDRHGLVSLLELIEEMSYGKSNHITENWQQEISRQPEHLQSDNPQPKGDALTWMRIGALVRTLIQQRSVQACPLR